MHMLRRRPRPSTIIATAALILATSGTAIAAGEIITSPDQIKDGVVTAPKLAKESVSQTTIKNHSVTQSDESNPTLRYSVAPNGTFITGDAGAAPRHVAGSNRYDMAFSSPDLGPTGFDTCGFAVSPRFKFSSSPSQNGHRNMRAYVNYARGSNTFQVFTFEQLADGREVPAETAFDVVVGC